MIAPEGAVLIASRRLQSVSHTPSLVSAILVTINVGVGVGAGVGVGVRVGVAGGVGVGVAVGALRAGCSRPHSLYTLRHWCRRTS